MVRAIRRCGWRAERQRAIGKEKVRQFAASLGYEIDKRDSLRGSTVMRLGADEIVVKRNRKQHYVYFSVREDRDNGTIIDFLHRRQKVSLGAVRQALRPWIGHPVAGLPAFPELEPLFPG